MRGSEVIGVGGGAATNYFAVDLRVPRFGMFELFEHKDTRGFAHHKTVAVLIVGTAGGDGIVVAFTKGLHRIEPPHPGLADNGFAAATDDDIGHAEPEEVEGLHDRIRGRRAGAGHCKVRTAETVTH